MDEREQNTPELSEKYKHSILEKLRQCGIELKAEEITFATVQLSKQVLGADKKGISCEDDAWKKKIDSLLDNNAIEKWCKAGELEGLSDQLKQSVEDEIAVAGGKLEDKQGGPCSYFLFLVRLRGETTGYAELFKFILQSILEKVDDPEELESIDQSKEAKGNFLEIFEPNWIFLGKYAEYVLKKRGLPQMELLTWLSAAKYEGRESEARIYFTQDEHLTDVAFFQKESAEDRRLEEKNQRTIRKLLELSKRQTLYLYAEKQEDGFDHFIKKLVRSDSKEDNNTYIKFGGFLCWSMYCEGKEMIAYRDGRFSVNFSKNEKEYVEKIKKLTCADDGMKEMLKKLVRVLSNQKHGTSVILTDDKGAEANRLCKVKRGTRLKAGNEIAYKDGEWNKDFLLSITDIDGAVFMSWEGECQAIGVIVDGRAKEAGDAGRGARYNSIHNYIKTKEHSKYKYIGVVISEDGQIDIMGNKP